MLVILRESIENLGRTGDIVKVADGYARNYLLPRNLVLVANENNKKALDHHKKVLEKKRAAEKGTSEELAAKLSEQAVTISRKVGEKDRLFGSVSSADIAAELAKAGFKVEKRQIVLQDPLKSLGVHQVQVKLQADVVATVKVWIVKQE
jgi:large subunit ribosomal protein L9